MTASPNDHRLTSGFMWLLSGNVIFAATRWGVLIVIARSSDPEALGAYALGVAVAAPIFAMLNLKLRAILATDVRREYPYPTYTRLRASTAGIGAMLVMGLALLWGGAPARSIVLAIVGFGFAVDSLSDIFHGYLQRQEDMRSIAVGRTLKGTAQLVFLLGAMAVSGSIVLALLAWLVAGILVTVAYDFTTVRRAVGRSGHVWRRPHSSDGMSVLLRTSIPLGLAVALGTLWMSIPLFVVGLLAGDRSAGLFAAAIAVVTVGGPLVTALGQSVAPRLAALNAAGDYRAFDGLMRRVVGLGGLVGLAGVVAALGFGRTILERLYGSDYRTQASTLSIAAVALGLQFSYVFLGTGIQAMRDFRAFLPIQLASLGAIAALSWMLVPSLGTVGAAWAMVGANALELLLYGLGFVVVRRSVRINGVVRE